MELTVIKILIVLVEEHGVNKIQVFGDSQLTIQWMKGEASSRNLYLNNFIIKVLGLREHFNQIYFSDTYKENNQVVGTLSKKVVELKFGELKIVVYKDGELNPILARIFQ